MLVVLLIIKSACSPSEAGFLNLEIMPQVGGAFLGHNMGYTISLPGLI